MSRFNGAEGAAHDGRSYDVVIVGSGPAGSRVAERLAAAGRSVAVVEEGGWTEPKEFPLDHSTATARYYRDHGLTTMLGASPTPYLQGRAVGGTSVVNGAISWRLPVDVHAEWLRRDPALASSLPYDDLVQETESIERRLNIRPTDPAIAGRKNTLMARGADVLGLEHRPISRNVVDCRGSGRCMQGCPNGAKQSMDRTYLADAEGAGADVYSSAKVTRLLHDGHRATGVAVEAGGRTFSLRGTKAVVVAASAVGTPLLLLRSGIKDGPVGRNFSCHPGTSVSGRFADDVTMWEGATQGHEVVGLRAEGLKFEALGFDLSVLAGRLPGVGKALMSNLGAMRRDADWGVAVKSNALGRVRSLFGRTLVTWSPTADDVRKFRRGVAVLGRLLLAAGAESVHLGVLGWHERLKTLGDLDRFEATGPLDARAYQVVATHLFGTARMGSDPSTSVVNPRFEHHRVKRLYVADSSVFPSNTGVNPQTSILALAALCGRRILEDAT